MHLLLIEPTLIETIYNTELNQDKLKLGMTKQYK